MKTILFSLVCMVIFLTSCNTRQDMLQQEVMTEDQKQAVVEEMKGMVASIVEGINKRDADLVFKDMNGMNFYGFINNGELLTNYDSTYQIFKNSYSNIKMANIVITDESYTVFSPDLALHTASFIEDFTFMNDYTGRIKGAWSSLFQKVDQEWKLVHVHQSYFPADRD